MDRWYVHAIHECGNRVPARGNDLFFTLGHTAFCGQCGAISRFGSYAGWKLRAERWVQPGTWWNPRTWSKGYWEGKDG